MYLTVLQNCGKVLGSSFVVNPLNVNPQKMAILWAWRLTLNGLSTSRLKTASYFRKKNSSQMFDCILNVPLLQTCRFTIQSVLQGLHNLEYWNSQICFK